MSLSEKEVLHYLGYRGKTADERTAHIISQMISEFKERITPRSTYGMWDCRVDASSVTLNGITLHSVSLAKHLKDCRYAAFMAATLGVEADTLIRRYSVRDMEKAVIAQAVCTAMIEEYCDLIESEISMNTDDGTLYASGRFSPGYGDFDIAHQKDILRLLNAKNRIGLTLTAGYMLAPAKSVTAVTGLSKEKSIARHCSLTIPKRNCENCNFKNCNFRK